MVRLGLHPASLALAAALCLSTTAHAAESPFVSQVSLNLTGLSFQLIDVNPGDGIAPGISFQTWGVVGNQEVVYDEASDSYFFKGGVAYSDSLLPSAPVSYVSEDGLSTINTTPTSASLQSQLPLSQLLSPMTPPNAQGMGDEFYKRQSTGTMLSVNTDYVFEDNAFTLTPGTGLIVRGTLSSISLIADGSVIQAELDANGYRSWGLNYSSMIDASLVIGLQGRELYDTSGRVTGSSAGQSSVAYLNDWTSGSQGTLEGFEGVMNQINAQDFEVTLVNFGDTSAFGKLALKLSIESQANLYAYRASIDIPIPAIPEPSTYALMGLGLVGIMGVTRRRRRAA